MTYENSLGQTWVKPKQRQAIVALINCPTIAEAARQLNIAESCLYAWLQQESFKQELDYQRNTLIAEATAKLKANTVKAADALTELLGSNNEMVKRGAANDILNHVVKFKEIVEFEARLSRIEQTCRGKQ